MDNIICEYGCGRNAKHQMSSGKWCCEPNYQKCPALRKKFGCIKEKNGMYNKHHSNETKKKISDKTKGKNVSKDVRKKMSITKKEMYKNGELKHTFKKGCESPFKGKKRPSFCGENNPAKRKDVRDKISITKIGNLNPAKRKEVRDKISKKAKQRFSNEIWLNFFKNSFNIKPNKPEKVLIDLLQILFGNSYKYTGDFSYWLGRRNPDFISISNKKIIELFGDYWHGETITGIKKHDHEKERIKHFKSFGFETLIIWEHELKNIKKLKDKIISFNKRHMI